MSTDSPSSLASQLLQGYEVHSGRSASDSVIVRAGRGH